MAMDAPVSPLVLTKLRVPAPRQRSLSRVRLIDRLTVEDVRGLTLVCAPAGYGKTTLLVEWGQFMVKQGNAVAWYALDPGDDDPVLFGSYLVASLIQALGPIPELAQIAQRLLSSPGMALERILPPVINAVVSSGRACVLILDDYHLISSRAIHSAVAYLLEHLPDNLRIAIGSRSNPPLSLPRLRARGQLLEIRAAHLRFKADETARFLNDLMRLDLSSDEITALEERTEGWIAGLQLAALSLSGRADKEQFIAAFTGGHRYLVEYLLEEVINRQPEEVQLFLLLSSVLERMCAPLCDALLGQNGHSQAILEQLEQANLFVVALDEQGYWYRYHHLFRDFLLSWLNKIQPERIGALHMAACEWLAEHQLLREAAEHAFQTHDWEYAAAFVEQYSFTLIVHSDIATTYTWCSAFPEEVMQRHPLLCIHQCWALVFSFQRQNRAKVESRLRQVEQITAAMEDRQQARELQEAALVVRSLLVMAPDPTADAQAQISVAQKMLAYYPERDAGQFSGLLLIGYAHLALHHAQDAGHFLETARQTALQAGLYFGVVESTFHLARLAHSQGRLGRAAELCRQGQADIAALLQNPEAELPAVGCLDIALGCVLLEQNQLDAAEQQLLHGLDLIGWRMNPYYLMTACVGLFRLRAVQGRTAEAQQFLDRLEEAWPDVAFCTRGLRAVLGYRTGSDHPATFASTADWREQFAPPPGNSTPPPGMGAFGAAEAFYLAHLAWILDQIATGCTQAARAALRPLLDLAEANGLSSRVIELSLLEAQAFQAEGSQKQAFAALERALALAQPEGYLRIFDQGPALTRLLIEAANQGVFSDYIGRILTVVESTRTEGLSSPAADTAAAAPQEMVLLEPLSERELEVLRLIACGASNQAIAEELVITVGTVKSHINHILGKLGAHNRTEAAALARKFGFLQTG